MTPLRPHCAVLLWSWEKLITEFGVCACDQERKAKRKKRKEGRLPWAQHLDRLSKALMKLSVPEASFSMLSSKEVVAKTTSLARNLFLNPKWMLKVCTRISFIL